MPGFAGLTIHTPSSQRRSSHSLSNQKAMSVDEVSEYLTWAQSNSGGGPRQPVANRPPTV